ncbi:MAG: hypothetical protein R3C54_01630 [Parvularculaceae bacterium]
MWPIAPWLEGNMSRHVLIQLPLLAIAGWFIGRLIYENFRPALLVWNRHGAAGISIAVFTFIFWMIPRFLDASLSDPIPAFAKYITIPLGFGACLGASWDMAPAWLRGFLKVNFLSMLIFLAWLYAASPDQLCNNYARDEQRELAFRLVPIICALGVIFAIRPLFGGVPIKAGFALSCLAYLRKAGLS